VEWQERLAVGGEGAGSRVCYGAELLLLSLRRDLCLRIHTSRAHLSENYFAKLVSIDRIQLQSFSG
jgi:hypothetical protein